MQAQYALSHTLARTPPKAQPEHHTQKESKQKSQVDTSHVPVLAQYAASSQLAIGQRLLEIELHRL